MRITKWNTEINDPFVGTVQIVCPFQGVREGSLLEGKSLFVQESAVFQTRRIQLSEPLGKKKPFYLSRIVSNLCVKNQYIGIMGRPKGRSSRLHCFRLRLRALRTYDTLTQSVCSYSTCPT